MYAARGREKALDDFSIDMQGKSHPVDRAIARIAAAQHGVISRGQLLALGLSPGGIEHRLRTWRLHRVHRGVYAVGHARLTPHGRFMAAVLACGDGALLSHRSAAFLWNLRAGGTRIEVTVPAAGRTAPQRVLLHRTRRFHPDDRTIIDGIPITSLARTLVDLAAVVDRRRFERAFEEAERIGKLDVRALSEALDRCPNRSGTGVVRALIAESRMPAETRPGLERQFIERIRDAGLPMPACNVPIEGYVVDAVWPEARLIVELDSFAFHDRTRRSFESDRRRRTKLKLAGWHLVELTSGQMPRAGAIVKSFLYGTWTSV